MTIQDAIKLQSGDEVYWTDPDDGLCSKFIVIQSIDIEDGVCKITDIDGGYLECPPNELS